MQVSLRGDDMAAYVVAANQVGIEASRASVRRAAYGARNELRRQIKTRFSTDGRIWNAKGFADAIRVYSRSPDWYAVQDKATYSKRRTQTVSLAWVFDNAPMIQGKKGWVAVPIRGQAPIAANGRRYAWPREAAAMGYELYIAPVMGKPLKIIFGRRGLRGPWEPLYYYIPPYRAAKRLDLDATYRKHLERMEQTWPEEFDKRLGQRTRKLLAA